MIEDLLYLYQVAYQYRYYYKATRLSVASRTKTVRPAFLYLVQDPKKKIGGEKQKRHEDDVKRKSTIDL
jgi:hypothetical protein